MIDIRMVRDQSASVKAALGRRGVDPDEVDRLVALDEESRSAVGRRDELRAQVKSLSKQVGDARRSGDTATADKLAAQSRELGEEERQAAAVAETAQEGVRQALLFLPNLPSAETPDGAGPEDNVVARTWPDPAPEYTEAQRIPHWEIGAQLGLLDMERGAKLSGSMFPLYRGAGARLLRALTSMALDSHSDSFEEIRPPTMVLTETMVSTGHLPKFEEDAYHIERDDLWAIPTAEVPLASMWRGDIIEEATLPVRLTAATSCFRREAGSAGRDTRGLLRVHEFDKVELFAFATPEQAPDLLAEMLSPRRDPVDRPRPAVPGPRSLRGGHGDLGGPHLRSRGVLPGCGSVAGGLLGQLVHRLPGASGQRSLPTGDRRRSGLRAHPQRIGVGVGPHLGRTDRDRQAGRRFGGPTGGAQPLPSGRDGDRSRCRLIRRVQVPARPGPARPGQSRGASNR